MSTENGPSTTAPDPKMITSQLRQEILDLEDDTETLPTDVTDDERWAKTHLTDLPITYSPAVAAAVDGLLRSRPLPDAGRRHALDGVERELAARRRMKAQLPVVLRAVREQRNLTLAALASLAGLDEGKLHDLETGITPVSRRRVPPETIAKWIRPLDPPHDTATAALRRSLRATTDQPALAAGLPGMAPTDEDYITAVLSLLGWTDDEAYR